MARIIDLEVERSMRMVEALGPLQTVGFALSEDGCSVLCDIPEGYVLTPEEAISLGITLQQLGETAKRESERA